MKRSTKIIILATSIIAVVGILVGVMCTLSSENLKHDTTDLEKYGEWYGLLSHSNLAVFPEQISDSAVNIEYNFYNDDNSIGPSSLVYLKCTYNEEDFKNEVIRLEAINGIRKDENNYNGTAYIALLQKFETEYALITDNNTIVYLCITEGRNPRTPDTSFLRNIEVKEEEWFSLYDFSDYNDYKYWPKSWK